MSARDADGLDYLARPRWGVVTAASAVNASSSIALWFALVRCGDRCTRVLDQWEQLC